MTPDLSYLPNDEWNIELNGGIPLVTATDKGDVIPEQQKTVVTISMILEV